MTADTRRDHGSPPTKTTLTNIQGVLDTQIRPLLHVHGGDLELRSLSEHGVVHLAFEAVCRACPLKAVTYAVSIRQRLMEVPGVNDVLMEDVRLSRNAIERVEEAYRQYPLNINAYTEDPQPATMKGQNQ